MATCLFVSMKQYPYIDIERAAMWGHSGGGFITADAMFRFPDFFKVGISESGNHDQRLCVTTPFYYSVRNGFRFKSSRFFAQRCALRMGRPQRSRLKSQTHVWCYWVHLAGAGTRTTGASATKVGG